MYKKYKIQVLAILLALILGFLFISQGVSKKDEISYTKPNWTCEFRKKLWECGVTFKLTNNTHIEQTGTLAIRGYFLKGGSKGGSSVGIGESKKVEFNLSGYQEKGIHETIYIETQPTFVNITFLN